MNSRVLKLLEFDKVKEKIFRYVTTKNARQIIDDLQPFSTMEEVIRNLNETSEAVEFIKEFGLPNFVGLDDVYPYLEKIDKGGSVSIKEIYKIGTTLRCIREVKDYLSNRSLIYLNYYYDNISTFKYLEDEIFKTIKDGEEISDFASENLFKIRKELRSKTAAIKRKLSEILKTYSKYLQENIFTVRGDRYCIPVKAEYKSQIQGIVHNQSSSGSTYFIEPLVLVNLNNEVNELIENEKEEIQRILRLICMKIQDSIDSIYLSIKIVYFLEFIFGKGNYAIEIDGIKPDISDEEDIYLISARHPLIDRESVVPLNLNFMSDRKAIIITGPNTGGKTVTLKTLGLMHLMAHSGLFIPAYEGSKIMFLNEIFADIGDEQSLEQNLSTFSSHIKNIINITNNVKDKTLILLDEVGSGTDPEEGAALAISIIEHFINSGCKLMGTTHYSQLKTYAINSEDIENASVEFDVKTLKPTYRLNVGIPGKSNAFIIADSLGMNSSIIESAKKYLSGDTIKLENIIKTLEEKTTEAVKNNREIEILREENKILNEKLKKRIDGIENEKFRIIESAKEDAYKIITNAKREIDQALKMINSLEMNGIDLSSIKDLESARREIKKKIDEQNKIKEEKSLKNNSEVNIEFKSGMSAFLKRIGQNVTILGNPDSKGNVLVQAGILKLTINTSELESPIKDKSTKLAKSKKNLKLRTSSMSTSIDLRGMDALNAISEVEKYLDDAFVSGLHEVCIIHGKGTGVLKNSINNLLRNHVHVKSHRLGEYGEGGDGVTIAYLK
ncbi:endonuclease MutS2 [Candidatus Arthromitus sp. SFB-rat-Yit]|uniref:endonuclease MutS2 n=1 Tax=Candidatus Arthromitus sp. SFB-rat-Yit TaxID=1041504 RepID=UPI000227A54B|nr:endonuclease MutS2 [Candidatus Arthromitus sp. SFB-rat-Yit]BAK80991.1 DNA mismatch repair MutS-like protein [Candidatus Arthromitus sp. SFB-rat-Yit]